MNKEKIELRNKELLGALATAQQKLNAIDKLSNIIPKVNSKQKDDVAYFIHRIIESSAWSSNEARELLGWHIEANKDIFIKVEK